MQSQWQMPQPEDEQEQARQVLISTYMDWTRDDISPEIAFAQLTQVCSPQEAAETLHAWQADQTPNKERRV